MKKILQIYFTPWRKIFTYSGRANRKEFWLFNLTTCIFLMLVVMGVIVSEIPALNYFGMGFALLYFAAMLSVTVRRLHDVGLPGWILILVFVGAWSGQVIEKIAVASQNSTIHILVAIYHLIFGVGCIVLWLWPGDKGDNLYGPSPKQINPAKKKPLQE